MITEMEKLIVAELDRTPGIEALAKRIKDLLAAQRDHIRRLEEARG